MAICDLSFFFGEAHVADRLFHRLMNGTC